MILLFHFTRYQLLTIVSCVCVSFPLLHSAMDVVIYHIYIYIYIYTLVFPGGPQHCSYGCVYVFRKRRCQCVWSPQWWWQLRAQGKESSLKNRHSPGLISVSHLYQVALEGLWVSPISFSKKKKCRKKALTYEMTST